MIQQYLESTVHHRRRIENSFVCHFRQFLTSDDLNVWKFQQLSQKKDIISSLCCIRQFLPQMIWMFGIPATMVCWIGLFWTYIPCICFLIKPNVQLQKCTNRKERIFKECFFAWIMLKDSTSPNDLSPNDISPNDFPVQMTPVMDWGHLDWEIV